MSSKVRLVLIDLSGTLHVGKRAIDGCTAALGRLEDWAKSNRASVRFLSNTTKQSKSDLAENLVGMGFSSITPDRILTPLQAARTALLASGSTNPLCLLSDSAKSEINLGPGSSQAHDGVVVGLDPDSLSYAALNKAFRLLKDQPVPFVATHRGRYFKDEDGRLSLGPGPFVLALEESSGRKATTVGKPSRNFFEAAIRLGEADLSTQIEPSEVVMIGDDVRDDIKGALDMGFRGVLVRTGKFKPDDAHGTELCVSSFAEFVELFLTNALDATEKGKL